MKSPSLWICSISTKRLKLPLLVTVLLSLVGILSSQTQPAILVSGTDYSLSVFDLATANPIEVVHSNGGGSNSFVAVGANPRLAVQSSQQGRLSLVDLTIQRQVRQAAGQGAAQCQQQAPVFTSDGKWILCTDSSSGALAVIDAATFRFVRKVPLSYVLGSAARTTGSAVVTAGRKAYVTGQPTAHVPKIAEVDLGTFRVRPILLPAGSGYVNGGTLPTAALTPDGRYLALIQIIGGTGHLRIVDTVARRLVVDTVVPNYSTPLGLVITPNGTDPTKVYGYLLHTINGADAVTAIDLRTGSPTLGQLIAGTDVPLSFQNYYIAQGLGLAISSDGSRVVATGQQASNGNPMPNVFVIDTGALLAGQGAGAVVLTATAAGGGPTTGVAVAPIMVTPPLTAPTVTQVSGNVNNSASTTIDVFGKNFAPGATVQLGSFGPLATAFVSPTDVKVTVPQNAPAGAGLDVVVTNPGPPSTPSLQNQSGLLAGGITITPNPAFQPQYQFAALGLDDSISVYDVASQSVIGFQSTPPQSNSSIVFDFDGAELYSTSGGPIYGQGNAEVLQWRMSDTSLQASVPIFQNVGYLPTAISQNPFTGMGHVLYVPNSVLNWPIGDIQINMIDVDPASPTFNTVLKNIPAGFNAQDTFFFDNQIAATPNGKFVYVTYQGNGNYGLAIFDVLHQAVTTVGLKTLGADTYQGPIQVTADGKWLLIHSTYASYAGVGIVVCDLTNPTNPTPAATVNGSLPNSTRPLYFWSFQVVGNLLFAADSYTSAVLAFTFDPVNKNFSQLAAYFIPGQGSGSSMAVTPDGALAYVASGYDNAISVLDANALVNGQPALITKLATSIPMQQIAVGPIATLGPVHDQRRPPAAVDHPSSRERRLSRPLMLN